MSLDITQSAPLRAPAPSPLFKGLRRLAAFALVPLLASCVAIFNGDDLDDEERDLNRQRRRWFDVALTDYDYVIERECFCGVEAIGPVLVEVRRGAVARMTYVNGGGTVPPAFISLFPQVEGLFGLIQDAIDDGADRLDVDYSASFSFPTHIQIDRRRNAADDELVVSAYEFRALR